jgi:hypothetical protein
VLVSTAGGGRAEATRRDSATAFWRARANTLPPACQLDYAHGPLANDSEPEPLILSLRDEDLPGLLLSAKRARSTPFQWALAAFAAVLFEITAQDLISVTLPFDLRSVAERDTAGMFVLPLPVRLERETATPGGLLTQVKREIATVLGHRFLAPETLDEVYGASASRWGSPWVANIKVASVELGQQNPPEVRIGSMAARKDPYRPRLEYTSDGIDLRVVTGEESIELMLCFSTGHFSAADAAFFAETLRCRLTDIDSHVCPRPRYPGLAPLRDSSGRAVMRCDIKATQDMIQRHPVVTRAEIRVEQDEDGGDRLAAVIEVSDHIDEETLRRELLAASSGYTLAPRKLSILWQGMAPADVKCGAVY